MHKNTLVPENLLSDVYRLIYYLVDVPVPDNVKALCESIETEIVVIINRRKVRAAYSAYKTAPPGPQRESLRLAYISLADIHRNFADGQDGAYQI